MVAKFFYLTKRARPDILTVASFLCTRVQAAMQQDYEKLEHVLVQGTVEWKLVLHHSDSNMHVCAYVDASYALHRDSKSHIGVVSSRKQKCMTKSPTEAELLGLKIVWAWWNF
jgi:hypothetical protein